MTRVLKTNIIARREPLTLGDRVRVQSYGRWIYGTVTDRPSHNIVFLNPDGTNHKRWAHLASVERA